MRNKSKRWPKRRVRTCGKDGRSENPRSPSQLSYS